MKFANESSELQPMKQSLSNDSSLSRSSKSTAAMPDSIRDGWFTETETLWPGQKFSLALEVGVWYDLVRCGDDDVQKIHPLKIKNADACLLFYFAGNI